ncbi:protein involved in endosome to golgi protein transport [Scheffersomyces stipitis CBS 6054]|uniref:Vacuolar protein sorting-associated protein 29 n=1 Tax=Scheffersomyces stipitis (strain ATCC 58785 / CBS 6054 / NBRC 10063 / NRRL Y-11545) TaxID=322104 RepID=A3GFC3_PICST|nr:protein involved in endosome to golgi protein transport [Scheffersomyces stipitis CBS 6054]EAZ63322.2 protein involved in endosome to golgi protein transport [Scheffersomyces stipitis CBS 6054]
MLTLAIGDLYIPERALDLPAKFRKLLCPNPQSIPTNSKISEVICLGNITNSVDTLKFLHDLSPSLHLVKGEFDDLPILSQQLSSVSKKDENVGIYGVITHDNLRIGFTNGYQVVPKNDPLALSTLARELDVDVLIWGGTHKVEAYTLDGKFFVNPGSGTGAFSFDWPEWYEEEENAKEEEIKENEDEAKPEKLQKANVIDEHILSEVTELNAIVPSFCLLDTFGSTCTLYIYTHLNGEVKVDKVSYTKE